MSSELTVATRKSQLALTQCRSWVGQLQAHGTHIAELHVTTTGDRIVDRALSEIGGKGLFIKEIEEAILEGRADFAVHSMKDVPALLAPGLELGSVSVREDPRDAIVTRDGAKFDELPAGSKVGTSSLRRLVQLKAQRPDLEFQPIRGNVDTRIRRCHEGVVDAVVLAFAGLKRLGLAERATQVFEPSLCIPAVGQGALAAELRRDDERTARLLAPLDDPETHLRVAAERGVMIAVEGNCQIPVAAFAVREGERLRLEALLAEPDGSKVRRGTRDCAWPRTTEDAEQVGLDLGRELRAG